MSVWELVAAGVLLLCASMYLGTGWSLSLFTLPNRATMTAANYYDQIVAPIKRATRFFTVMTVVMIAAAIALIVGEWGSAYIAAPAVVLAAVVAATGLTTLAHLSAQPEAGRPHHRRRRAPAGARQVDLPELDPDLVLDGAVGGDGDLLRLQGPMRDPLRLALLAIAAGTFLSGIILIAAQGFVLDLLSAPTTTSDRLFFGIIGMFMAVVGGALTQTLLRPPASTLVVGWSAVQKLGAAAAMSLAVVLDVFSYWGLALSVFDFSSALLAIGYWWRIRS